MELNTVTAVTDPAVIAAIKALMEAQAARAQTDWQGLALAIAAIGTVIAAIFSGMASLRAGKADKQAAETHQAVNSRMDEFKRLFEQVFIQRGAAQEVDRQRERERTSPPASTLVDAAEEKARALIAEATVAAANVIAEAHRVAATKTSEPMPVQVVNGPGVDSPLKVTTVKPEID